MTRNGCKMRVTIVGTHLGESVFIIKEGRIKRISLSKWNMKDLRSLFHKVCMNLWHFVTALNRNQLLLRQNKICNSIKTWFLISDFLFHVKLTREILQNWNTSNLEIRSNDNMRIQTIQRDGSGLIHQKSPQRKSVWTLD